MYKLLEKLGQNPQSSLKLFLYGLGLFLIALIFITLGYFYHHLWQIFGIILLVIACLLSVWGYIGMFSNRWLNVLYKNKTNAKRDLW
jgi:hypothetical protein